MADSDKLEARIAPVVQREFLEEMLKAFPPYRVKLTDSIELIQREAGKQDVIDWIKTKLGIRSL